MVCRETAFRRWLQSMRWPLAEEERSFLRELHNRNSLLTNDRRIVLPRRSEQAAAGRPRHVY